MHHCRSAVLMHATANSETLIVRCLQLLSKARAEDLLHFLWTCPVTLNLFVL